jgi:hypothetical protein
VHYYQSVWHIRLLGACWSIFGIFTAKILNIKACTPFSLPSILREMSCDILITTFRDIYIDVQTLHIAKGCGVTRFAAGNLC